MLLETFLACNCVALASKMVYTDVEKVAEIKKNILENGLYHITREESADKILQSGYIRPSGSFLSLGRKKVFFFAGIPEPDLIRENILELYRQYEWTAIKVMPNEKDLDRYKTRNPKLSLCNIYLTHRHRSMPSSSCRRLRASATVP